LKRSVKFPRFHRTAALVVAAALACVAEMSAAATRTIDVVEAPVAALQEAMSAGRITSRALTARSTRRGRASTR